jgi:nitroreductase
VDYLFGCDRVMNVFEAIRKRCSVRNFLDMPMDEDTLLSIMEAGRLAPSAKNRQEWRFIVVRDGEVRRRIGEAANGQSFVGKAPVVIVACGVDDGYVMSCGQPSYPIDVAIALDHISLAAVEHGLGTCWIGAFNEQKVKEILGIPENVRVVELMPIGYPIFPSVKEKNRFPLEKIIRYDRW